jgi:hypothetical protein
MFDPMRRFRGLGIAVVVLTLSAGAVFAGNAALTELVASPTMAEETPDTEPPADAPETDDPAADAGENAPAPEDAAEGSHGTLVSEAAQMETPAAFETHGAFVSCVAKLNNGQWGGGEPADPVVLAELTPDKCAALAEEAAAAKAAAREAAAAERTAAKAAAKAGRGN